jgi:hypothetical protein
LSAKVAGAKPVIEQAIADIGAAFGKLKVASEATEKVIKLIAKLHEHTPIAGAAKQSADILKLAWDNLGDSAETNAEKIETLDRQVRSIGIFATGPEKQDEVEDTEAIATVDAGQAEAELARIKQLAEDFAVETRKAIIVDGYVQFQEFDTDELRRKIEAAIDAVGPAVIPVRAAWDADLEAEWEQYQEEHGPVVLTIDDFDFPETDWEAWAPPEDWAADAVASTAALDRELQNAGRTGAAAFGQLLSGSQSFGQSIIGTVIPALAKMAASMMGGPFGAVLGGLFGGFFSGGGKVPDLSFARGGEIPIPPLALAGGGTIPLPQIKIPHAAGGFAVPEGPRGIDSVPIMAMPGEHVIDRTLSHDLRRFLNGLAAGTISPMAMGGGGGNEININVGGGGKVSDMASDIAEALEEYETGFA